MDRTENWDVYDERRSLKGRIHPRGLDMPPGDYHLVVQIWICNEKGEYLIQKRSMQKDTAPGLWATTAGSAVVGEDSRAACLRETEEEIGLVPDMDRAAVLMSYLRDDSLIDVWWMRQEADLSVLVLQAEEVDEVRWAAPAAIQTMVQNGEFWPYSYLNLLESWTNRG